MQRGVWKSRAAPHLARREGLTLENGSRVAVVGGGPAGCFFSHFLLRLARLVDLEIEVEIFEPRHFTHCGPAGCNHCGGIISESLVQLLATEGINLPAEVVRRGIDSYQLHMDVGEVRIETPLHESRIAAVYRGNGPREAEPLRLAGFDRFLQELAEESGARVIRQLVTNLEVEPGCARVTTSDGATRDYDFVAVAVGINTGFLAGGRNSGLDSPGPDAKTTFIAEFRLGAPAVASSFGTSMHVFLLDLPRLEFAALIPKGEFVTMCMLGRDIDTELVERFLDHPVVRDCFPGSTVPEPVCHCLPRINVFRNPLLYGDRFVMVGDCGVARLYKDGIGSAYRTAKAAAATAVLHGVAREDFARFFAPTCRAIDRDNAIGRLIFLVTHLFQRWRFSRRALLHMTQCEQRGDPASRYMSRVLWDVFSGSAPYREVLLRTLQPGFFGGLLGSVFAANRPAAFGQK